MLRITAYADRLARRPRAASTGRRARSPCSATGSAAPRARRSSSASTATRTRASSVFTTRPDTLMGAPTSCSRPSTRCAPAITAPAQRAAVDAYVAAAARKSDRDRTARAKKKTGVPTGAFADPPDHRRQGADLGRRLRHRRLRHRRRHGRARRTTSATSPSPRAFDLPDRRGREPGRRAARRARRRPTSDDGVARAAAASSTASPRPRCQARRRRRSSRARPRRGSKVTYKLRDWVFSRQRYWGEPIPIYFPVESPTRAATRARATRTRSATTSRSRSTSRELPLRLPELADFSPGDDPAGPLARAVDWRFFQKDGRWFARETNTMPQWAGSCWYYLRFLDPTNDAEPWSRGRLRRVDAGRPLRRRRRARRAAPALRALLAQGALRPRPA